MGNRLSRIYTRTGDDGTTGLGDGSRIDKDAPRMETIGDVDELNAHIGLLLSLLGRDDPLSAPFERIQHDLFDLGGELAVPGYNLLDGDRTTDLEVLLDQLNDSLPPLKNFILPGGNVLASQCHLARVVCRRAERSLVALSRLEEVNEGARKYLNRLSDLLFVTARTLARRDEGEEVLWLPANQR